MVFKKARFSFRTICYAEVFDILLGYKAGLSSNVISCE